MAMSSLVLVAASLWAWGLPPPPVEPIEVKGGLDPYIVRHFVSRRMNDVNFCYEHALAANPTLTGRIVVKFTIGAPGEVVASEVQSSTMANPAVEACVAAVVRTLGFPYPRPPGPVTVTYPFAFAPWRATPTTRGVEIEPLGGDVLLHRSTDANGIPSNGLIVDTGGGLLLIDTAWTEAQTEVLLRHGDSVLRQEWIGAVITHDHADRAGGLGALFRRGIPVAAVDLTVAKLEKRGVRGVTTLFAAAAGVFHDQRGFYAFYPGPGHAPDNIVVKVGNVVFGGCLIKSTEARDLGFTGDANLTTWPAAVRRVGERYARTVVVPGHGPVDRSGDAYAHTLKLLAAARPPIPDRRAATGSSLSFSAEPAVVAADQPDPVSLATDGTDIVWGCKLGVFRARRDGAGATRIADIKATALAIDRGDVFIGGPDAVWRLGKASGAPVKLATARTPAVLAVNDTHVFWTEGSIRDGGQVARVSRSGGAVQTLFKTSDAAIDGLALDPLDIYFTVRRGSADGDALMRMRLRPLARKPETLLANQMLGHGVAVDGSHVYFSLGGMLTDNGRIARLIKWGRAGDTAVPEVLADKLRLPGNLFVHGDFVHAIVMGVPGNQGAVVRVPRAGGRLDVLANGQPFPFALAHDDDRVYWTVLPSNHRGAVLSRPLAPPLGPPLLLSTPLPAVCAGARLDLDNVLRNAEACWPRRNPEAGDSHARARLETDPIVVAAGATASVGVSLENATAAPVPVAFEAITDASALHVEVLRGDGQPLSTNAGCPLDVRASGRYVGVELPAGGRVTKRLTIAGRIEDLSASCQKTFRPLAAGRYRIRVETPFIDPSTQRTRQVEGVLLVK